MQNMETRNVISQYSISIEGLLAVNEMGRNGPLLKEITIRIDHIRLAKLALNERHDTRKLRLANIRTVDDFVVAAAGHRHGTCNHGRRSIP